MTTKTLYRPVGEKEMILIIESNYKKIPNSEEWKDFLSLETNKHAAKRYAKTYYRGAHTNYLGFVIEFEVTEAEYEKWDDKSKDEYEKKIYVPKNKLEDFNEQIVGEIKATHLFVGYEFKETKNETIAYLIRKLTKKEKITREEFTLEILELIHKFKYILFHQASNIYIENPSRMIESMYVRYRRICSVFESMGIIIKDVKHLNDLEFIEQYKEYSFAEELLPTIKNSLKNFYKIEEVTLQSLKATVERILQFRDNYISNLENFFGGIRIEGAIPIEEHLSKRFVIESIMDIDTLVERLNRTITLLLFPNIQEFDVQMLVEKFNFPTEDYEALEHKEEMEYWNDF